MTVMLGEIQGGAYPQKTVTGRTTVSALPSAAMAFLVRDKLLNPKNAEYKTRGDGIPIHTCVQNLGASTLEAESFCNTERVTTAFTKLIVRNNTKNEYNGNIGLITRTGPEFDLLGVYEPDGYNELEPSVFRWMLLPQWKYDGGKITDGTYSVYMHIPQNVSVSFGEFFCNFTVALPPCAEAVLHFAFGRGEISSDFSYDDEKAKTEAFWEHELSKIKVFPKKDDSYFFAMYRSLVSQGLQMFCYPQGVNYALLRQGGLQRLVWPTENRCMIRALARIGDFGEYLEPIFNTYFHVMQANSGQIKNFGIPWSSVTGSISLKDNAGKNAATAITTFIGDSDTEMGVANRLMSYTDKDGNIVQNLGTDLDTFSVSVDNKSEVWVKLQIAGGDVTPHYSGGSVDFNYVDTYIQKMKITAAFNTEKVPQGTEITDDAYASKLLYSLDSSSLAGDNNKGAYSSISEEIAASAANYNNVEVLGVSNDIIFSKRGLSNTNMPVCPSRNSFYALLHLPAYAILRTKLQAAIPTDLTSWTFHILPELIRLTAAAMWQLPVRIPRLSANSVMKDISKTSAILKELPTQI